MLICLRWPDCHLLTRDGQRVQAAERVMPCSGLWNSGGPSQAAQPVYVTQLEPLPGLQLIPDQWTWPAELP